MNIPDEFRRSVVYVGSLMKSRRFKPHGTAFLVRYPVELGGGQIARTAFLLTAKHVVEAAADDDVESRIRLRANISATGAAQNMSTTADLWHTHPTDDSVDVAVMAWPEKWKVVDFSTVNIDELNPISELLAERGDTISEGAEVMYPGLFVNHPGKGRNVPIVRSGTIALIGSPDEPVASPRHGPMYAHLIESRSVGGLSGSPVFVRTGPTRFMGDHYLTSSVYYYLFGLIHGHFSGTLSESDSSDSDRDSARAERLNQGIAVVVPTSQIVRVFEDNSEIQRILSAVREQVERDGLTGAETDEPPV